MFIFLYKYLVRVYGKLDNWTQIALFDMTARYGHKRELFFLDVYKLTNNKIQKNTYMSNN